MKKYFLILLTLSFAFLFAKNNVLAQTFEADLARCLTESGFVMYGESGCGSCELQKGYFGGNFRYISYVDCSQNQALCKAKKITGYPTWIDRNGKLYKGAIPLQTLSQLANCHAGNPTANTTTNPSPPSSAKNQIILAFIAGLISFLAPCLLPLFPSYFSIITGFTFAELYGLNFEKIRPRVFFSAVFFSLGFILVFTLLGATGSFVSQFIANYQNILLRVSGIVLIGLGLVQTGFIKIHSLQVDYAWNIQRRLRNLGFITAFATGITASLCWIPCVGPLLTPIFLLAAGSDTVYWGAFLLFIYSLGLTFPFLLGGLYFPAVVKNLAGHRKALHYISVASGIFLMLFGIFIFIDLYPIFVRAFGGWINVLGNLQLGI